MKTYKEARSKADMEQSITADDLVELAKYNSTKVHFEIFKDRALDLAKELKDRSVKVDLNVNWYGVDLTVSGGASATPAPTSRTAPVGIDTEDA